MNSFHLKSGLDPIIEHLYEIIDTKIQYIDFQTNALVSTILGYDVQRVARPEIDISSLNSFNFAHNNCDSFLTIMEEYSKTKRLLLLMRSMVTTQNHQLVFDLLSNNQFIHYSEKQLSLLLEESLNA